MKKYLSALEEIQREKKIIRRKHPHWFWRIVKDHEPNRKGDFFYVSHSYLTDEGYKHLVDSFQPIKISYKRDGSTWMRGAMYLCSIRLKHPSEWSWYERVLYRILIWRFGRLLAKTSFWDSGTAYIARLDDQKQNLLLAANIMADVMRKWYCNADDETCLFYAASVMVKFHFTGRWIDEAGWWLCDTILEDLENDRY